MLSYNYSAQLVGSYAVAFEISPGKLLRMRGSRKVPTCQLKRIYPKSIEYGLPYSKLLESFLVLPLQLYHKANFSEDL